MSKDQKTHTKSRLEKGHCTARHSRVGVVGWPCTAQVERIPSDTGKLLLSRAVTDSDLSETSGSPGEHTGGCAGEGSPVL